MWYSNMYRRHLCDMHIDDWNNEFLSKFSPEEYVKNLKTAHIQNAMIYFQSHVGLCYYPTEVGHIHKAFIGKEDMIKKVVDLCHENNIMVTGYYSLNYNTIEHDLHKDWRMIKENGKSQREDNCISDGGLSFASVHEGRYGLCCPNNFEYREFVYKQIDEMLEYFDCEGLFFDMPYWPHTCYCDKCQKRWENEVGTKMPVNPNIEEKEYITLLKKKYQWMGEWIQSVTDYVKAKAPEMSVEHNYASAIAGGSENGCGEKVNEACDFVGGDLYGGMLNHSLACKFYKNITKNMPFDYMFSRCKPALRMHTLTKSDDEMKAEVMLTAAHHGATMVIDAIDPVGTMDKRVYEKIGAIFEYESAYEPYLKGIMREDVGIYYSIKGRYSKNGRNSITNSKEVTKTLVQNHIPFGVTGNFGDLSKYKLLIVPLITEMEEKDNERILKYVENGGSIYLSKARNKKLIEKLLDCKVVGETKENNIYFAPKKQYEDIFNGFNENYPLPFENTSSIIELNNNSGVIATVTLPYTEPDDVKFASIHSNPPGHKTDIPAAVIKKYGKGKVIWSSVDIEGNDIDDYKEIFMNMLLCVCDLNNLSFECNAPDDVEVTVFDTDDSTTVNVIHLNEKKYAGTVSKFDVSIKYDKNPNGVFILPQKEKIPFEYSKGYVKFKTRELNVFDMYIII